MIGIEFLRILNVDFYDCNFVTETWYVKDQVDRFRFRFSQQSYSRSIKLYLSLLLIIIIKFNMTNNNNELATIYLLRSIRLGICKGICCVK